jgi:hypothetical protein
MLVSGDTVRKEFQGDEAMQASVFGLVDNTHSTTTEFFNDPVVRDRLADERLGLRHLASMLGRVGLACVIATAPVSGALVTRNANISIADMSSEMPKKTNPV